VAFNSTFRQHRKFLRLCRILPKEHPAKLRGHVENIWDACNDASNNNETFEDRDDVELVAEWDGEEGSLLNALLKVGLLEKGKARSITVHDYWDWCPHYVVERVKKRRQRNKNRDNAREVENRPDHDDQSEESKNPDFTPTECLDMSPPCPPTVPGQSAEYENKIDTVAVEEINKKDEPVTVVECDDDEKGESGPHDEKKLETPKPTHGPNGAGLGFLKDNLNGSGTGRAKARQEFFDDLVRQTRDSLESGKDDLTIIRSVTVRHEDDTEAHALVEETIKQWRSQQTKKPARAQRELSPEEKKIEFFIDLEQKIRQALQSGKTAESIVERVTLTCREHVDFEEILTQTKSYIEYWQKQKADEKHSRALTSGDEFEDLDIPIEKFVDLCNTIEGGHGSAPYYTKVFTEADAGLKRQLVKTALDTVREKHNGNSNVRNWGAVLGSRLRNTSNTVKSNDGVPF
jgi:hypothetical protein